MENYSKFPECPKYFNQKHPRKTFFFKTPLLKKKNYREKFKTLGGLGTKVSPLERFFKSPSPKIPFPPQGETKRTLKKVFLSLLGKLKRQAKKNNIFSVGVLFRPLIKNKKKKEFLKTLLFKKWGKNLLGFFGKKSSFPEKALKSKQKPIFKKNKIPWPPSPRFFPPFL